MKKREITHNELEQIFDNIIEQSPLITEEQTNSLLNSLPTSESGSALKRFLQYHLNTFLLSASILLIIVAAFVWGNSNKGSSSVENIMQSNEILPALTDTIAAKSAVSINNKRSQNDTLKDTISKKSFTKISSEKIPTDIVISLSKIYKSFYKQPQVFTIQTNRDTTIICKEGTSIKIKANSFILEKSGKEINGKVQIAVKEHYKVSEIILSQLTTTSGGRILETGGMVNVKVTSDNKNCVIKPGSNVDIGFPYLNNKDDMELFYGQWTNDEIDWEVAYKPDDVIIEDELIIDVAPVIATQEVEIETQVFFIVEDMPEFPGGSKALEKYLQQNARYPYSALENKIEGKVYVTFVVDKSGYPNNISVARGLDKLLDKVAVFVVSNMPKWKPGKQRGKSVNTSYTVAVPFSAKNGELTTEEINQSKVFEEELKDFKYDIETNSYFTNSKIFNELEKKVKSDSLQDSDIREVNRYIFSATQLGWINCDRFYNNDYPTTNIFIPIDNPEKTKVTAIFHRFKAIIRGNSESGKTAIKNIPLGESITIVALKTNNNKIYLAIKEIEVTERKEIILDYQPVTMDLLKKEMKKLNKLYE